MSETIPTQTLANRPRLSHLIDAIAPHLDPVLFAPESLDDLRSLTAKLPPINFQLFEVRLSDDDPSIDLSIPLTNELFAECPDWCLTDSWQNILALKKACEIDGEFAGAIGCQVFWGEFDRDNMLSFVPIPGIFFDVYHDLGRPENKAEFAQIICRAWEILLGKFLPESSQTGIKTALMALPDYICSTHFGIMLPRLLDGTILPNSLRLHPAHWQLGDLPHWLQTVGAGSVASEVERVTREIPHLLQRAIVTVDAGATVGSRVGIECYPTPLKAVNSDSHNPDWMREFIDWLIRRSLASDSKVRALLNWYDHQKLSIAPTNIKEGQFNDATCHLNLSHIKLVFEEGIGLQAKAYLLANFVEQEDLESEQKSPVLESFESIWKSQN